MNTKGPALQQESDKNPPIPLCRLETLTLRGLCNSSLSSFRADRFVLQADLGNHRIHHLHMLTGRNLTYGSAFAPLRDLPFLGADLSLQYDLGS